MCLFNPKNEFLKHFIVFSCLFQVHCVGIGVFVHNFKPVASRLFDCNFLPDAGSRGLKALTKNMQSGALKQTFGAEWTRLQTKSYNQWITVVRTKRPAQFRKTNLTPKEQELMEKSMEPLRWSTCGLQSILAPILMHLAFRHQNKDLNLEKWIRGISMESTGPKNALLTLGLSQMLNRQLQYLDSQNAIILPVSVPFQFAENRPPVEARTKGDMAKKGLAPKSKKKGGKTKTRTRGNNKKRQRNTADEDSDLINTDQEEEETEEPPTKKQKKKTPRRVKAGGNRQNTGGKAPRKQCATNQPWVKKVWI